MCVERLQSDASVSHRPVDEWTLGCPVGNSNVQLVH